MSREEATPAIVDAAREALAEIASILEDYQQVVIIGGNVPYLAIPQDEDPHEGTVDIDMVFARPQPRNDEVMTFHEVLMRRNFVQDTKNPFRFTKVYGSEKIVIDLLAGGTPPASGMVQIPSEELHLSVIQGAEVALLDPDTVLIPGTNREVRIANIAAFFAMKSLALEQREESKKPKDAYDIIYCLRNYPGGDDAIVDVFVRLSQNLLIQASLERLKKQFSYLESVGPTAYASRSSSRDEYRLLQREAYERMKDFLERLNEALPHR